jgi:hypothetical protein
MRDLGIQDSAHTSTWSVNMSRIIIWMTIAVFGGLTGIALRDHGVWGIIAPHFRTFGAGQVFADLLIALTLAMVWIVRDAKASGRNPLPWVVLTLATGSFGPLFYLLARGSVASQQLSVGTERTIGGTPDRLL